MKNRSRNSSLSIIVKKIHCFFPQELDKKLILIMLLINYHSIQTCNLPICSLDALSVSWLRHGGGIAIIIKKVI